MKYEKYEYKSRSSYTSYSKLSLSEAKAIENSNFDNIPKFLIYKNQRIELFDECNFFAPIHFESNRWRYNKKSNWCTHLNTGIKVRLSKSASPNYYQMNGNGVLLRSLEVWFPK